MIQKICFLPPQNGVSVLDPPPNYIFLSNCRRDFKPVAFGRSFDFINLMCCNDIENLLPSPQNGVSVLDLPPNYIFLHYFDFSAPTPAFNFLIFRLRLGSFTPKFIGYFSSGSFIGSHSLICTLYVHTTYVFKKKTSAEIAF